MDAHESLDKPADATAQPKSRMSGTEREKRVVKPTAKAFAEKLDRSKQG